MTTQEKDRIECAIRHIQTAVDVDQWAVEIAVEAMEKQIPKEPAVMIDTWICPSCNNEIEYQFLLGDNVLFHGFHDFCPKCGQTINWEEEW